MNVTMKYKNYIGSVEFSEEDELFYGKVLGIRSLLLYEGHDAKELIADFHSAVDAYLDACEEEGSVPEVPYKGSFNVRVKPEIHRRAAVYSLSHGITLNKFVEEAVEEKLAALS